MNMDDFNPEPEDPDPFGVNNPTPPPDETQKEAPGPCDGTRGAAFRGTGKESHAPAGKSTREPKIIPVCEAPFSECETRFRELKKLAAGCPPPDDCGLLDEHMQSRAERAARWFGMLQDALRYVADEPMRKWELDRIERGLK